MSLKLYLHQQMLPYHLWVEIEPSGVFNLIFADNPIFIYPISESGSFASIINFSSSGTISATVTPGATIARVH